MWILSVNCLYCASCPKSQCYFKLINQRLYTRSSFQAFVKRPRDKNFEFLKIPGETVQKWTRAFSTRRWVILVARMRRKKEKKILASTFGQIRLWTTLFFLYFLSSLLKNDNIILILCNHVSNFVFFFLAGLSVLRVQGDKIWWAFFRLCPFQQLFCFEKLQ